MPWQSYSGEVCPSRGVQSPADGERSFRWCSAAGQLVWTWHRSSLRRPCSTMRRIGRPGSMTLLCDTNVWLALALAGQEAVRIHGLQPGQWIDLEWPPPGYLEDPGYVYTTDFEPCEAHAEPEDAAVCDRILGRKPRHLWRGEPIPCVAG